MLEHKPVDLLVLSGGKECHCRSTKEIKLLLDQNVTCWLFFLKKIWNGNSICHRGKHSSEIAPPLRIQEAQVLAPFESLITPLPRAAAVQCQRPHAFPTFEPYATKHHQSSSGQHGPIIIRDQRPLRERNGNIGES
jgi:hypothetical protein